MVGRGLAAWVAAVAISSASPAARGDGAFPDGQNILVPADRPDEIVLGTNFGLLISEDAGRSWLWSCEQAANSYGRLYQMGPAPTHRLFAIANGRLVFSDDGACGWRAAGGALGGQSCEDAFVDPTDDQRVFAAGLAFGDGGTVYTVLESTDGGETFDRVLFTGAPGDLVTGVESARSDPMTIDLALARGPAAAPALARSTDGGGTWQLTDLTAALGAGQVRIVAIDPTDADRVFLDWTGSSGDALAIATDGGARVTTSLTVPGGALTAFVRTSSGVVLAAETTPGPTALFRSRDGGATFVAVANPPSLLALAERAGTVYAATDTMVDPFEEATSTDDGTTWTPGLTFTDVQAIAPCLKSACQTDCAMRAAEGQWPATMCSAAPHAGGPPGTPPDAAVDEKAPGVALGPSGGTATPIDAGRAGARRSSGCACAIDRAADRHAWPLSLLLLILPLLCLGTRSAASVTARVPAGY